MAAIEEKKEEPQIDEEEEVQQPASPKVLPKEDVVMEDKEEKPHQDIAI